LTIDTDPSLSGGQRPPLQAPAA